MDKGKIYVKATSEGRLYIKTSDFFKSEKVITLVDRLKKSSIYSDIEKSKIESKIESESVIWRCNEDITDLCGSVMFTKGLIYEQVKTDQYPMMLVDNNVEESEVYNLKDSFTSI